MVYIDENGNQIESYDLTKGYLVDAEWVDHPAVEEVGHYDYELLEGGGRLQRYIVDTPYQAAWREVVVMKYILYTEAELEAVAKGDYNARLEHLEADTLEQRDALEALIEGVSDA